MKYRGPRLRICMMAIAVLAVICALEVMRRRSVEFRRLSVLYGQLEEEYQFRSSVATEGVAFSKAKISINPGSSAWNEQFCWWSQQVERNTRLSVHYGRLKKVLQRASKRPWMSSPSEPFTPAREPLLPPPDLPLTFTNDPKTHQKIPEGIITDGEKAGTRSLSGY
jgi:hypothetical protein